jgi:nicotinamide mononucleotide transporter
MEWMYSVIALVALFLLLIFVLKNYTDSDVPMWDALTTAIFIVGMWFMALKKIENWIYWIVGDLISIPLYASKDLILTSIQFTVFLGLAIAGYRAWKMKIQSKATNS